jgi:hypothetical protein
MKKFIIVLAMIALCSVAFATRIAIPYNGVDYILNTSQKVTEENTAYINGMFDAFTCLKENRQLYEIQTVIAQKVFTDETGAIASDNDAKKTEYLAGFLDCMKNYSYGSNGNFEDVYPIYASLMAMPISYKNARLIVEFGGYRFYIKNL